MGISSINLSIRSLISNPLLFYLSMPEEIQRRHKGRPGRGEIRPGSIPFHIIEVLKDSPFPYLTVEEIYKELQRRGFSYYKTVVRFTLSRQALRHPYIQHGDEPDTYGLTGRLEGEENL